MKRSRIFLVSVIIAVVAMSSCTRKSSLGCPQNFGKMDQPKTEQKHI